jgi:hypothetical protein
MLARVVRVSGAQDGLLVGQQLPGQVQRRGGVPALAGPVCDVGAGGQSVGVAGALHGFLVGQQLPGQVQRRGGVPAVAGPVRDVGAGGQRVGVEGALGALAEALRLLSWRPRPWTELLHTYMPPRRWA